MDEESTENTSDLNPEEQQSISERRLEEDRRAAEAMEVTIRIQKRRISDLTRQEQLLRAENEAMDKEIKQKQKERSEISCFLSGSQVADLMNKERAMLLKQQRSLQEQLEEYRLALESCREDLDKKQVEIEHLERSREDSLTLIQELRTKNSDLDLQIFVHLENAMGFDEPQVDQLISEEEEGQLPHSYVEVSDMEEEQEEKQLEASQNIDVQTKSWWRQQAEYLWKVVKRMGTFCQGVMRCQRLRSFMRQAFRSNQVHPVCDDMLPV